MKKFLFLLTVVTMGFAAYVSAVYAQEPAADAATIAAAAAGYTVGPEDVLGLDILEPEKISTRAVVSPDGSITAPYIGQVQVAGQTANQIRETIEKRLSEGYLKYPSVMVSLLESHSRKFFVYGAVNRPGEYALAEKMSVLRAISMAGGFTKFGSASRVKVLRAYKDKAGYETIKIKIKDVMDGDSEADLPIENGDIIVISEGVF
jgi:polysaccharide export outer membrane protein